MYFTTVRAHNTEAVSVYLKMGVEIDRLHLAYHKALEAGIEVEPHEFIEIPEHLQEPTAVVNIPFRDHKK